MSDLSRFHVAVIGGGPAGLMAADFISAAGARVTIIDRMPSAGRKFLMAGRGGLNLTHSEDIAAFLSRYGEREGMLKSAIEALPPTAIRAWCEKLGQPTFVGSSGRIFPRAMKTSPLLRAWLADLAKRGVSLETRSTWTGWNEQGCPLVQGPDSLAAIEADASVLALGGSSWPGLGSDGEWVPVLRAAGIEVAPLMPANCGFTVAWSSIFRTRFEGQPLKRIAINHEGRTVRGEAILTASGIEGGAIYALSPHLRKALGAHGYARITIDLRPDIEPDALAGSLRGPQGKQSLSTFLRKAAQLTPAAIGLLQEQAHAGGGQPLGTMQSKALAGAIKAVPVELTGMAPLARAISTAGGIAFGEIDPDFMLVKRPGTFVAGEMLDWEAPTGGYLLQACFSTGAAAGRGVVQWLARKPH